MSDVQRESITIWSQGVRLAGDIYKPGNLKATETLPGILMVPGWGGSKKNLEKNYAPHFAEKGFVVLAFDFKSWGESDGPLVALEALPETEEAAEVTLKATHIREFVNPLSMSEDVRAALNYLGAEPWVMPENLGIWGTSMGGGLALAMAASDDRIKALVSQMGPVNYKYNLIAVPLTFTA
jgi:dienelactone hydrolase